MTRPAPNLLWIFCDQLRWHALGCHGDPNVRTPNLDRLAAEGADFSMAISQYPVCTPFRGGLVTGQHAHANGVRVHGDLLAPDRRTIAHAFRDAGYRTSWVGKWHLASVQGVGGYQCGGDYWVHPLLRGGFEDWFGFDSSNHFYKTRYSTGEDIWPPRELHGYQTDALTDLSLNYLSDTATKLDRPWFHVLSVEAPHWGTDAEGREHRNPAPPEYERRFDPARLELRGNVPPATQPRAREMLAGYYAQIENLDFNVGRVLRFLDERGLAENTLVAFFSDHGEMAGSHGRWEKTSAMDESIRIPLMLRLPGQIPAGRAVSGADAVASGIDIFPTCASLCGVPVGPGVQGMDLSAAARGDAGPSRGEALVQWLGRARYGFGDFQYRAIRTGRHTYCVGTRSDHCLLYDNAEDPLQLDNRFGRDAALQRTMHRRLCRAVLESGEPVPEFVAREAAPHASEP
jgi:arylsulfatase A-like enzyme